MGVQERCVKLVVGQLSDRGSAVNLDGKAVRDYIGGDRIRVCVFDSYVAIDKCRVSAGSKGPRSWNYR